MRSAAVLLISLFLCLPSLAQNVDLPKRQGVVSDNFEVLNIATRARIEALAAELKSVTSINLAIALIKTSRPLSIEEYGQRLYKAWDVGQSEEGLDHGVLMLISIIDREVKIIPGSGIDFLFSQDIKERMEMSLYPLLGEGRISDATLLGSAAIANYLLSEWPKYQREGRQIGWQEISKVFFALTAVAVLLTLIYGGTILTMFGTIVGGIFGFIFFGIPGMLLGATIGFMLNIGRVERKLGQAEKEMLKLYRDWKSKKEVNNNEDKGQ
ncbi:MAG: TPM domain-containing protein [Candidatus Saganbacteria bacterium]|nr:TPM domain-containing protein [Candidatus Saganbacteria bacterium]